VIPRKRFFLLLVRCLFMMGVLPVSGTAFVLYDGPEHPETEPSHFSQKKS
jgi:hypothetical protein